MASRSVKQVRAVKHGPVVAAYERAIAILHEQLADCRKERDAAIAREQDAHAQLMQIMTAQQFSPVIQPALKPPYETSVRNMRRGAEESDPFREVPFGDPMASFKSPEEADLMGDLGADLQRALGVTNGNADNQ